MEMVKQYEIYLVKLDPTQGSEIKKTRPCVIISPNEINKYLETIVIAPLTSSIKNYPTRVTLDFQNRIGQIVLDQILTVDKSRLVKRVGSLNRNSIQQVKFVIKQTFVD